MTEPDELDLPDSGMASGSDAGAPGERLRGGDLSPDEQRLLAELQRGVESLDRGSDAELRAAADEVPLPAKGGLQGDGLEAEFSAPER
ncbi:hypothetical protein [Trujillonella endophytica]|uniref:Uncharacterized protein n=1 Tax=Trujillonella endophytica TaxID=673521 RepID=A0A1H8UPQ6_9ACTN|nr:hypothetical protein [Trujillella endophytica]SEP04568.1 hypothetical protein SAMN05660991_02961 [Trujillella endophytica]